MRTMKTAIMYGGGNIGRGFIGKVFADSGYEVCFLDIMQDIIDEMNARGQYTVRIVSNQDEQDTIVKPVRAVNSLTDQAIEEIVNCEIMATAVGVNVLPRIAPVIAKGIAARMKRTGRPLDIILCENQLGADELMRGWINEYLSDEQCAWADDNLGLVEASVGRMVPPLTPEMRAKDKLLICVEPYSDLPVDRDAFKGPIPYLKGLIPYSPFEFYIKRKLFLHNGGHALCAYLGYEKGCEYIWQAIADPEIYEAARAKCASSGGKVRRGGSNECGIQHRRPAVPLPEPGAEGYRGPGGRGSGAQAAAQRPHCRCGPVRHRAGRRSGTYREGHRRRTEVRPRGRQRCTGNTDSAERKRHRIRAWVLYGSVAG